MIKAVLAKSVTCVVSLHGFEGRLNKFVEQSFLRFLNRLDQAGEIDCNRLETGRGLGKQHLLKAVL